MPAAKPLNLARPDAGGPEVAACTGVSEVYLFLRRRSIPNPATLVASSTREVGSGNSRSREGTERDLTNAWDSLRVPPAVFNKTASTLLRRVGLKLNVCAGSLVPVPAAGRMARQSGCCHWKARIRSPNQGYLCPRMRLRQSGSARGRVRVSVSGG